MGRTGFIALAGILMVIQAASATASDLTPRHTQLPSPDLIQVDDFAEPWNAGWTLAVDNDAS